MISHRARKLGLLLIAAMLWSGCERCGADPAQQAPPTPPLRPQVIEVHGHIGADSYDLAMEIARENGIGRIVNLSGGNQARGLEPHLEAMRRHPGRIAVFYNIPWRFYGDPRFSTLVPQAFEKAVQAGYAGLKVPKVLGLGVRSQGGGFLAVDDPTLDPIWAKAGELGVPVSIHTGDPKAFFEPATPENERFAELSEAPHWSFADPSYPRREELLAQRDRLLARHRGTTFILVHFGNNPEDIDYVDRLLDRHPNAYVDVSARLAEIGRHPPDKVKKLFIKHRRRILFGTDLGVHARSRKDPAKAHFFLGSLTLGPPPTRPDVDRFYARHWAFFEQDGAELDHPVPIQGAWKVRSIHLPADVLEDIYHKNAYRLIFAPHFRRMGIEDPLLARRATPQDATPARNRSE